MNPESRFRREPGVLLREIDGELLLLNSDTDSYYGLNPVGAEMYQTLIDGSTAGETVAAICASYEADEATVARDLATLLDRLVDKGLIAEEIS